MYALCASAGSLGDLGGVLELCCLGGGHAAVVGGMCSHLRPMLRAVAEVLPGIAKGCVDICGHVTTEAHANVCGLGSHWKLC